MNFGDERLPERFWSKCIPEPNSGCWLWFAAASPSGHGRFGTGGQINKKQWTAYRYAYTVLVGPVPDYLVLDHLCRTPECVNPLHLEMVTQAVNVLRGDSPQAQNARQTHCIRGHEFTGKDKGRRCLTCKNANRRLREARAVSQ